MRRFPVFPALVVIGAVTASATLGAQDVRIRDQKRIVVPQEVIVEVQRVLRDALNEDVIRDITREISRSMGDLSHSLGHISVPDISAGFVDQDRNYKFEQTDKQTKTLSIGASGSLKLKNVVGNITVKAGSGRDATVEITRVSRGATDADAKLGLQRVTAEVASRDSGATVEAKYPEERRPNYSVSIAMTVTAPAGTKLIVESITGDVSVTGIKGETSLNTTTGNLEVSQAADLTSAHTVTGRLTIRDSQGDALDVSTMNGHVELTNVKAKRLELTSVVGTITAHDVQAGGAEVTTMSGSIEYGGTVTSGGRYEFTAHNGAINLALAGGFSFEGSTFAGQIEMDPQLGFKSGASTQKTGMGPGRRQSSLNGTVGNGGAFVEARSFNGHISVSKTLPKK